MNVYDEKYIKGVIKTNFLGDEIPKENIYCIAYIIVDCVMRMENKIYLQVYLEECKQKPKKIKMTKFIDTELESESESELDSDAELESKPELESGTE